MLRIAGILKDHPRTETGLHPLADPNQHAVFVGFYKQYQDTVLDNDDLVSFRAATRELLKDTLNKATVIVTTMGKAGFPFVYDHMTPRSYPSTNQPEPHLNNL